MGKLPVASRLPNSRRDCGKVVAGAYRPNIVRSLVGMEFGIDCGGGSQRTAL